MLKFVNIVAHSRGAGNSRWPSLRNLLALVAFRVTRHGVP